MRVFLIAVFAIIAFAAHGSQKVISNDTRDKAIVVLGLEGADTSETHAMVEGGLNPFQTAIIETLQADISALEVRIAALEAK